MKRYNRLLIPPMLLVSIAGCSSQEPASPKPHSKDQSHQTQQVQHPATVREEISAQISSLNKHIREIKLPQPNDEWYLIPASTASFSKEQDFSLTLKLEQRTKNEKKNSGLPLNITVKPYQKSDEQEYIKQGFTKKKNGNKTYLIHPDPKKSEIVFTSAGYLYHVSSSSLVMNQPVYLLNVQELINISQTMNKNSAYKEFLRIEPHNYVLPEYFTDSEKDPISIMVSYSNPYGFQSFNLDEQELIIQNGTMQLFESRSSVDGSLIPNESNDEDYTKIEVDSVVGYLQHSEPYKLVAESPNGVYLQIKPASEVNETTGSVWTKEVPNWEEEAKTTFISMFAEGVLPPASSSEKEQAKEKSKPKSNQESSLFKVKDQHFSLYGMMIGATTSEMKDLLGSPQYEGADETGFDEWIQQYEKNNIYISFHNEQATSFSAEVNEKELERAITENFQGEKYISEEGTKYLYLPETEELLMYTSTSDSPNVTATVTYADGNFKYWVEEGSFKKYY
ncbi:hypothetical protein JOC78_002909 [Bacillus ectoiniformans]|uniref:hypothetical protein n=1 Tax=Bacillus ectoiniformans TaxID=1494429 RepID=UPI00195B25CF|nr:hypothetical protein [Bacillus ectoiniformans]MBM7649925.1 hypothetical protein [Bacillus ectoiniformans]